MDHLLTARSQMGISLGFHILFAVIGVALPLMMVIAEGLWHFTGDEVYQVLAKRWAKGTVILFAIGSVSGTVLSFELGLLWPLFMEHAGAVIGMPFSLEGFAFFTEAIFLGIYLYGWERTPAWLHLFAGLVVCLSGMLSAAFVTMVNAWMNTPRGFDLVDGKFTNIHPLAAMLNPAAIPQAVHMILAAYAAAGFATAGIHSFLMLRRGLNRFDQVAIGIALSVGGVAVLAQGISGDALSKMVAVNQPMKLASLEGQFHTERGAPLRIGGLPNVAHRSVDYAITIPHGLSLLAFHSFNAEIAGLDREPEADWPNVVATHLCFQVMVGCGSLLSAIAVLSGWLVWRRKRPTLNRWFLRLLVLVGPLGFIALEAGWMDTELGRQPWIIYKIMRTRDAVTPMPYLTVTFTVMSAIYVLLGTIVVFLISKHIVALPGEQRFAIQPIGA